MLIGDFDVADELLFAAANGGLRGLGPIRVQWSARLSLKTGDCCHADIRSEPLIDR
jgi:hypothetical protein